MPPHTLFRHESPQREGLGIGSWSQQSVSNLGTNETHREYYWQERVNVPFVPGLLRVLAFWRGLRSGRIATALLYLYGFSISIGSLG